MTSIDAPTPSSLAVNATAPASDIQPWWRTAVVYQVYPRSFADADGDGIGDLAGLRSRLDHLQRLGVDVIWLCPVYVSPGADNGYDIADYEAIDPTFGTLEDFDALLADLHGRGMRLIIDLVVNHTSDEHPWFAESRSSRHSPRRDWYVWRPARPGHRPGQPGAEPTNWTSFFSGPTWTYHEATGEYYLHLFDRKQPDLNWRNPDVRQAIYQMMRWWLDRGVDGFRMDVINLIAKDPTWPDGEGGNGFPHYANRPEVHEYLREMHREVFEGRDGLLTVGEMPGVTLDEAVLFTDPARRELDMVFQFEHVSLDHGPGGKFDPRPLELTALKASLDRWQTGLHHTGWNSLYFSNHDQPRSVSRFGDDGVHWRESATALATVLHMHRGTPYVYQGEEIGMTNMPVPDETVLRDVESLRYVDEALAGGRSLEEVLPGIAAMGRDHARTPMQWDGTQHAGFTTGAPWIEVNRNHKWLNARAQYDDPHSVFNHYRRLIELRHTLPVVAHGDFRMLWPNDEHVYGFERTYEGTQLLTVANLSGSSRVVDLGPGWTRGELVLTNMLPANRPPAEQTAKVTLRPWEARVLISPPSDR